MVTITGCSVVRISISFLLFSFLLLLPHYITQPVHRKKQNTKKKLVWTFLVNMYRLLTIYRTSTKAAPIMSSRLADRALGSEAAVTSAVARAVVAVGTAFPRVLASGSAGSARYVHISTLTAIY
jgi:hypothetical protein